MPRTDEIEELLDIYEATARLNEGARSASGVVTPETVSLYAATQEPSRGLSHERSRRYTERDDEQGRYYATLYGTQRHACFYSAQMIAQQESLLLRYCEGFAVGSDDRFVLEHAWLLDRHDRVIEVTFGYLPSCVEYFGFTVPVDMIRRMWVQTRMARNIAPLYPALSADGTHEERDVDAQSGV